MDQVTEQPLHPTVDSREESLIDQRQGSQAPAPAQLLTSQHLGQTLATSIGDSDSQRNIGENSEGARRQKRRMADKKYRDGLKHKRHKLEDENDLLKQENDRQKQLINSLREEGESLKGQLKQKECQYNDLLDRIVRANEQSVSTPYMQRLLAELNQKLDGLQQNINQLPGTQVHAQPRQPQSILISSQGLQAPATTLLPTQSSGTGSMQEMFQFPRTFTSDFPGLPEQQLGQTAHPIHMSSEFSLHQEQGGNPAIESQPFTQGLADHYPIFYDNTEDFDYNVPSYRMRRYRVREAGFASKIKNRTRGKILGRNHARSTEQPTLEALEAENASLKREDQQMKSNIEVLEAEHTRLKREIEEKEQRIKSCLGDFESENGILMREIEKKEQKMKSNREAFEAENGQLKHEIEEKERLMKSNMEGFEVKNGKLTLEIGEKEQPMKSNLESLEAEHGRLKREIEKEKLKMKSNLERLEAQIRQLVDEFKSLNEDIVAVNLRMQTHQGNYQKARKQKEKQNILN